MPKRDARYVIRNDNDGNPMLVLQVRRWWRLWIGGSDYDYFNNKKYKLQEKLNKLAKEMDEVYAELKEVDEQEVSHSLT